MLNEAAPRRGPRWLGRRDHSGQVAFGARRFPLNGAARSARAGSGSNLLGRRDLDVSDVLIHGAAAGAAAGVGAATFGTSAIWGGIGIRGAIAGIFGAELGFLGEVAAQIANGESADAGKLGMSAALGACGGGFNGASGGASNLVKNGISNAGRLSNW